MFCWPTKQFHWNFDSSLGNFTVSHKFLFIPLQKSSLPLRSKCLSCPIHTERTRFTIYMQHTVAFMVKGQRRILMRLQCQNAELLKLFINILLLCVCMCLDMLYLNLANMKLCWQRIYVNTY